MNRVTTTFYRTTLTLAGIAMVSACGGGGSSGTSASNPPALVASNTTVYAGPIAGFGSVIVNGMRFSSVGAELRDDDGLSVNLEQLKLGMGVRISGDANDTTQLGTASQVELVHGTRGEVTLVNAAAGTLTVMGQLVKTNATTAFQGVTGLSGLNAKQLVEVHGTLQADGSLLATLIEVKTKLAVVGLDGRVSNLGAASFQIGDLTVKYSSGTVTGTLADGKRVKVRAATVPINNVLTATSVKVIEANTVYGASVAAGAILKLKGMADAAPVNNVLNVAGTPVNVAGATIKGGAVISAGQLIEVKGNWDGNLLRATEVELEGWRESQIGGRNELYGAVSSLSGSNAVVNGVNVDLSRAVFEHGNLAQVAMGSYVEIKGNLVGSVLQATKVDLKTTSAAVGVSYEQNGQISGFISPARFMINGLQVGASQARFERGDLAGLANGVYVEIKGTQNASGIFVASKIEIKAKSDS